VSGGLRQLNNEELNYLYFTPSTARMMKSRRVRREGHATRMGQKLNACRLFVGKPEEKRLLERPGCE
jgi:hypothetical protein